ncbi:MAG: LysR family transcriptional regulator [Burkholderiales bacterium]
MFDWDNMRYFAVFAREKSLSATARQLKVDHATVARRIAALEAALNLKLVDRRARAYVLTVDGERIAALGIQMEEQAFAVRRAARAGQQSLTGEVSISAPPTMATALIAPRLDRLRHQYPGIHIRLIGETRMASLLRQEADLAVRLGRPAEEALVARKIGSVAFALYASPAYLALHLPEAFVFIAYDGGMEDSVQQRWLKASAGTRAIALRANNLETQWAAARAGVGIALLPHFLGDRDNSLQRLAVDDPDRVQEVWLIVHDDLRNAPAVRVVMDFLVDCYSKESG